VEALLSKLVHQRFERLNEVQKKAWPVVDSGASALIIAPTGFGKTEAALLPIFNKLVRERPEKGIVLLYITPLKALNRDMLGRIEWWCKKLGLRVGVRHGDTKGHERKKQANTPPHLMITTPETLAAMLVGKKLGEALANVRAVVVDEVHELYGDKRGAQLALSLERLAWRAGEFQRVGLSATIGNSKSVARFLTGDRLCTVIDIGGRREMKVVVRRPGTDGDAELASKLHVDTGALGRLKFLKEEVLKGKALVFVNTRSMAEMLVSRLLKLGCKVAAHHGSLSRETRLKSEQDFRGGKLNALVCTSSLELGIDIGDIERVVQYSSPRQASRLVQRVGRSGHAERLVPRGAVVATDMHDEVESKVIADRARQGLLERERMIRPALDVLGHALAGIAVERGGFELRKVLPHIRRTAPYAHIEEKKVTEVAGQLVRERILRELKGRYEPTGRALLYYYKNVSTIPRTRKAAVRNAATNSIISSLDEGFVATLEPGVVFLSKGVPWRVLDVGEEIVVEPSEDLAAAIPSWIGEQIPVDYEVAQEVCEERYRYGKQGGEGAELFGCIPAGRKAIVVEKCEEIAILHICGGSRVNRTLGLALSAMLSAKIGSGVRVETDAYSIIMRLPYSMGAGLIASALRGIKELRGIVRAKLLESGMFKYRITHVARLFGLIEGDMVVSARVARHLSGTPIYEEATESVLFDQYDVEEAEKMMDEVRSGAIEIIAKDVGRFSALSRFMNVRVRAAEFLAPIEPSAEVLKAFSAQIADKSVRFLCTYCKSVFYKKVRDVKKKVRCPCGSTMVSIINKKENPKEMLKKRRGELLMRASLVEAYGRRAALAFSTYGIGSRGAARVLARLHKREGALFADLLEAQKQFIRTKRYWQAG